MKNYQYKLLRYAHDQFTGEFVNLGVILYASDHKFLRCKVANSIKRAKGLFPEIDSVFLLKQLRNVVHRTNHISQEQTELFKFSENLTTITSMVLPPDDSALFFSETKFAMDIDFNLALNDLFLELVEKYQVNKEKPQRLNDDEVWKSKYKTYFDKYRISEKLTKHDIATKSDVFSFEKAWKNEIWHLYEPVSFDLKDADRVKDKVYKWSGRLLELQKATEKIHLTFLTSIANEHKDLEDFILKSLDKDADNVEVDVIQEHGAEQLARKIKTMIEDHDAHGG